eukprot:PITA_04337
MAISKLGKIHCIHNRLPVSRFKAIMMSVAAEPHSKHYPYNKSQFDCNNSLSNSCPNVLRKNNSGSQSDSNSLGRPVPRSMRTFRSRFDEGGGKARAVESRVFSGPIDKNLQAEGWFSGEGETDKNNNSGFLALENSSSFPMRLSNASSATSSGDVSLGPSSSYLADEVNSLGFSLAFSDLSSYSSDISGELQRLATITSPPPVCPPKETASQAKWIGRFVKSRHLEEHGQSRSARHVSPLLKTAVATSGTLETENLEIIFKSLVEDLESTSTELQRNAAAQLRLYAKNNMENRIMIAKVGAVKPLVSLLHSVDPLTQENAVTALLNLSLYENNKFEITEAGAIKPLIHVLKSGTSTAKENAACTLLSLSLIEDNKVTIGASGAIPPLVALLINGSLRGKKDAATTLYTLSSLRENKEKAIRAGVIRPLVDLMAEPSTGMVDKSAVLLGNLASIPEGKTVIVDEGGIPVLVEVVEVGSPRGKEHATATLLQLCEDSYLHRTLVLREGAIPPLVALSQSGTTRAKQKV